MAQLAWGKNSFFKGFFSSSISYVSGYIVIEDTFSDEQVKPRSVSPPKIATGGGRGVFGEKRHDTNRILIFTNSSTSKLKHKTQY